MKPNLSVIEKWTRWRRAFLLHFLLFHWLCIMLHFYLFLLSLLCLTSVLISLFFFPHFQINHLWSSFHLYIIIFLIFSLYCILKSCICRSITMCCLATHLISCSLDFSSSLYSCFFFPSSHWPSFCSLSLDLSVFSFFFQCLGHTDLYSWM